jgi:OPT family oligopeptide transporter
MAGVPMGLSVLMGAVVAWGIMAPVLSWQGIVNPNGGYDAFAAWLTWPGVGLMVGAAVVSLGAQARSLLGAARDLRGMGGLSDGADRWVLGTALMACVLAIGVGRVVFGLPVLHTLMALGLVLPLCAVCGRGAGQTDISPVSQMGQLTQVASGRVFPGPAELNVAAGSVVAGAAAQTGVSLWSLKAGQLLKASPLRQFQAQLLGVLVGALVGVPAYLLLANAYGIGGEVLPVPSAHQFRVLAEVSEKGFSGLPPHAGRAAVIGFVAGVALTLISRGRLARWVPSAAILGIGFILPAHFAVTIALGAFATALARRATPEATERHSLALGAGGIAGESLMGLAIAALVALGFIQRLG